MPLIKDGRVVEDPWKRAEDLSGLTQAGPLFTTLDLWRAARATLVERQTPLGLWLRSDQPPEDIADDLGYFAAIALEFPKFTDGRPYSSARVLRDSYGFPGELRAVGEVLRDQLLFMHRCGFDTFELRDGEDSEAWIAALREFSVWYQPAADGRTPVASLRRRSAIAAA